MDLHLHMEIRTHFTGCRRIRINLTCKKRFSHVFFDYKSHLSCFLGLQVGVFQNWNHQAPTNPFEQKAGATGWMISMHHPTIESSQIVHNKPWASGKPDLRVNRSSHNFQILSELLMHKMKWPTSSQRRNRGSFAYGSTHPKHVVAFWSSNLPTKQEPHKPFN